VITIRRVAARSQRRLWRLVDLRPPTAGNATTRSCARNAPHGFDAAREGPDTLRACRIVKGETLDDFTDLSGWSAVTSGQARLDISPDRGPRDGAMRLDFDFKGGGGFVVARKRFALRLPDTYAFTFDVRGVAPANKLEFKLVDRSGHNVLRYQEDAFGFSVEWRPLRVRSSQIDFAWGPAGSGPARQVGAIELVIAAAPGGKGTVWIANLGLEDHSYRSIPVVQASSALPGHEARWAVDRRAETSWRSEPSDEPQWFLVDFGEPRDYGGLLVRWDPATRPRPFDVEISVDGMAWETVYSSGRPDAARSYVYLPQVTSQQLRLRLHRGGGDATGIGIAEIDVRPIEFSRSLNAFFRGIAANEPRGSFPRYLGAEQTYWTPVSGVNGGTAPALLNEDGLLEVDRGTWSIEPFLYIGDQLVTWADAAPTQELEQGFLPIPSSVWRKDGITLRTTAFTTGEGDRGVLYVRYRIGNLRTEPRRLRFFAALRPFQVTPPWQAWHELGGVARITTLEYASGVVSVNRENVVVPLTAPSGFGAAAFERADVTDYLRSGDVPPEESVRDGFGYASGALRYDLDLPGGSGRDVYLAASSRTEGPALALPPRDVDGAARFDAALREWRAKLGRIDFRLPPTARAFTETFRTAAAHILVNRDGPALQPGPRRYARSWIRDGATMAAALLRAGCTEEVRDYVRWYARHQAPDGTVPCCVDRHGPDWLVEHDSQGELIHTVMEHFRFTGDRAFLTEMWPAVTKSVDRIEALRNQRLTAEFQTPEKRACYGLLPESVSHEGYLAHPVHAYWDDFWALRGLKDAAAMARVLADRPQEARLAALRDSFRETLLASIVTTMTDRGLDYIPASVEWADADPAATANAIVLLDETRALPQAAIERTFDEYLSSFRKRRGGELDWTNYSPYEIRIIGALLRLGRRELALELAQFFLGDRRPSAWNQWSEIAWRDPRSPGHIGDMPHTWVAAEFALAFRSMLAFERETDDALVVAAGIPAEWLEGDDAGVGVDSLPTWYGTLGFAMQRADDGVDVDLTLTGDMVMPAGGIVVRPPGDRPLRAVVVNGKPIGRFTDEEATVEELPAKVRLIR
jgi:F5/8 type C domain